MVQVPKRIRQPIRPRHLMPVPATGRQSEPVHVPSPPSTPASKPLYSEGSALKTPKTPETLEELSYVTVHVAVAVSESGLVSTRIANSHWLTVQREYETWLKELRESKLLWSIKVVTVKVPDAFQIQKEPL